MADAILGGFSRAQERTHAASAQLCRCQAYGQREEPGHDRATTDCCKIFFQPVLLTWSSSGNAVG